jgi:hypothetical protein
MCFDDWNGKSLRRQLITVFLLAELAALLTIIFSTTHTRALLRFAAPRLAAS